VLAWFAWFPLLAQVATPTAASRVPTPFALGWTSGLVFWLMSISWLNHVTWLGMVSLCMFLALYTACWSWFVATLRARWPRVHGVTHILLSLLCAAAWVALEWLRGWIFGGFPWNFAAVSQYRNLPLIQTAAWTGAYGVSFVILFFNVSLWFTWCRMKEERFAARSWRYEFSLALFLVAALFFVGFHAIRHRSPETQSLKIGLIQPNIPQEVKFEPLRLEDQLARLEGLTKQAAAFHPDLILWPETALVDGPTYSDSSRRWLRELMKQIQIPILLGALDAEPDDTGSKPRWKYYNGAILLRPNGMWDPIYRKLHLVPFGEYLPLEKWFPWARKFVPGVAIHEGQKPVLFHFRGARLGGLICFEDTFPSLARALDREGVDILVNLTNDAWFKKSPGAAMHAANAVLRCVETRHPMIRCANSGYSLVIGPYGQIVDSATPFEMGFKCTTVPYEEGTLLTFYSQHGDWFAGICLAVSGIVVFFLFLEHRRKA